MNTFGIVPYAKDKSKSPAAAGAKQEANMAEHCDQCNCDLKEDVKKEDHDTRGVHDGSDCPPKAEEGGMGGGAAGGDMGGGMGGDDKSGGGGGQAAM